jgi:methyltransferase (TIGR00027 family)
MTSSVPGSPGSPAAPTGVGRTALMVAAARATETRRADRLFSDPYAADFLRAGGTEFAAYDAESPSDVPQCWPRFADYGPIRTRFFDDYLLAATREIRQVVILAAGLDTRAFRLPWPAGVTVYELDTDEVLAFKQHVLDARGARPGSRRVAVAVDLRDDWPAALAGAGFDPATPSAWLVEGLVMYLTPEQNDRLVATITAQSAPASQLSVEYLHADTVALMVRALTEASGGEVKAMWSGGGVAEESSAWLGRHGWDSEASDTYERAVEYGRDLPPLGDTPMDRFATAARNSLVIARRR